MPYSEQQTLRQLEAVFGSLSRIATGRGSGAQGQTISVVLDQPIGSIRSVTAECYTPCPPPKVTVFQTNSGQWYAIGENIGTPTNTEVSQNRRSAPPIVRGDFPFWQLYAIESDASPDTTYPFPEPGVAFRYEFDSEIRYIKQVGVPAFLVGTGGVGGVNRGGVLYHRFFFSTGMPAPRIGSATFLDPWTLPDRYAYASMHYMHRIVYYYDENGNPYYGYEQTYPANGKILIEYAYHPEAYISNGLSNWALKVTNGSLFHTIRSFVGHGIYTVYFADGTTFTFTIPPTRPTPPPDADPPAGPEPPPITNINHLTHRYYLKFQNQTIAPFAKIETAFLSTASVNIIPLSLLPISNNKCLGQIMFVMTSPRLDGGYDTYRTIHTIVHNGRTAILKTEEDLGKSEDIFDVPIIRNNKPRLQPYLNSLVTDLNLPNLGIPAYANLAVQIEYGSGNVTLFPYRNKPVEAVLDIEIEPPDPPLDPPPETDPPTVRSTIIPTGKNWFARSSYYGTIDSRPRRTSIQVALTEKDLEAMGLNPELTGFVYETGPANVPIAYSYQELAANLNESGTPTSYLIGEKAEPDSQLLSSSIGEFKIVFLRCLPNR